MAKKIRKTIKQDRHDRKKALQFYRSKVQKAAEKFARDEKSLAIILALLGVGGRAERLLCSDAKAAYFASRYLAGEMQRFRDAHPGKPLLHITFTDDCGIVSDRVPRVPLVLLQQKVRRGLRRHKLHGICITEAHPLMNWPGKGHGRTLLFHTHAIAWSDGEVNVKAIEADLNSKGGWTNALCISPVKIRLIGNTRADLEAVARYLEKRPDSAKNRRADKRHPGQFLLMDTRRGYPADLALRCFEWLSQVELIDLVFGVGEGTRIRQAVRNKINAWHRARPRAGTFVPADFDVWAFWLELRQQGGSKTLLPFRFNDLPVLPKPEQPPRAERRGHQKPPFAIRRGRRRKTRVGLFGRRRRAKN